MTNQQWIVERLDKPKIEFANPANLDSWIVPKTIFEWDITYVALEQFRMSKNSVAKLVIGRYNGLLFGWEVGGTLQDGELVEPFNQIFYTRYPKKLARHFKEYKLSPIKITAIGAKNV